MLLNSFTRFKTLLDVTNNHLLHLFMKTLARGPALPVIAAKKFATEIKVLAPINGQVKFR